MSAHNSSLAVLLDNARAALFDAAEAGLHTRTLFISVDDLRALEQTAAIGHHCERPLRLLGMSVMSRADLPVGTVQLAAEHETPISSS